MMKTCLSKGPEVPAVACLLAATVAYQAAVPAQQKQPRGVSAWALQSSSSMASSCPACLPSGQ